MAKLQEMDFFLLFSREKSPSNLTCVSSDVSEEISAVFYIVLGFPKIAKSAIKDRASLCFKKLSGQLENTEICAVSDLTKW